MLINIKSPSWIQLVELPDITITDKDLYQILQINH